MTSSRPSTSRPPSSLDVPLRPVTMRSVGHRQPAARPIVDRVRAEFIEMRGFSPTVEQAARLFDLPREVCHEVLTALVREGFLNHTPDGRYRLPPRA